MGQFVDEAVEDPGKHIAARGAPRPHRDPAFERGLFQQAVGQPATRKFIAGQSAAAARLQDALAVALDPVGEGDEMIVPGDQLALGVDAAPQVVEAASAEMVVLQIVFARPGQLHRRLDPLRDGRGLDDEV